MYGGCGLRVLGSSGQQLASGTNSVTFEASSTAQVTLEVRSNYGGYTGTYSVSVADLGTDDHGDSIATATSITLGVATGGSLEFIGDTDFFSVTLSSGVPHTASVTGTSSMYVDIFGPTGAVHHRRLLAADLHAHRLRHLLREGLLLELGQRGGRVFGLGAVGVRRGSPGAAGFSLEVRADRLLVRQLLQFRHVGLRRLGHLVRREGRIRSIPGVRVSCAAQESDGGEAADGLELPGRGHEVIEAGVHRGRRCLYRPDRFPASGTRLRGLEAFATAPGFLPRSCRSPLKLRLPQMAPPTRHMQRGR